MTEQLGLLPGVPVDPTVKLTARQRFALELIARLQPVPSDELGAYLCERRGKHHHDDRCDWDSQNGRAVGAALRRHGLVRQKRHAGWVLATGVSANTERDQGEIPY